MAIDILQTVDIIEATENFIAKVRPPENIRDQVDISYKIDKQSILIFELRPFWNNPTEIQEFNIAKTTYVKSTNSWKVFWLQADLKWLNYSPKPFVKNINDFLKLVIEDKNACFWG